MERITSIKKILDAMENGDWKTWWSDAVNRTPNFEEAFFAYVFKLNGLDEVEREYVVGRYPIDFAVPKALIAIEIDSPCCRGRGGKNSKKKKADVKREYLESLGWTVHQIRWWRKPFKENKKHTKKEINKILDVLENVCVTV